MKAAMWGFISLMLGGPLASAQGLMVRTPATWFDVSYRGFYYLTETVTLSERIHFAEGGKFRYVSTTAGYGGVTIAELAAHHCDWPELTADMILHTPENSFGRDRSVGVELKKNCHLIIYIENQDLMSPSFFTDSTE